jgi:hypothetical protein
LLVFQLSLARKDLPLQLKPKSAFASRISTLALRMTHSWRFGMLLDVSYFFGLGFLQPWLITSPLLTTCAADKVQQYHNELEALFKRLASANVDKESYDYGFRALLMPGPASGVLEEIFDFSQLSKENQANVTSKLIRLAYFHRFPKRVNLNLTDFLKDGYPGLKDADMLIALDDPTSKHENQTSSGLLTASNPQEPASEAVERARFEDLHPKDDSFMTLLNAVGRESAPLIWLFLTSADTLDHLCSR